MKQVLLSAALLLASASAALARAVSTAPDFHDIGDVFQITTPDGHAHTRLAKRATPVTVKVIHTNDIHVHYDEFNSGFADCSAANRNQSRCYGGFARMKYVIDGLRANATAAGTPNLLLDGGDQFQGNLFYTYYKPFFSNITAYFVNTLGYDVMSLGNHEFDDGPSYLAKYIAQTNSNKTQFVSANLVFANGTNEDLKALVAPYAIVNVNGVPICFVGGVTNSTPSISSPGPNIAFQDPAVAAQKAMDLCKAQGPKIGVLVTHIGYDVDLDVGRRMRGVQLIIGGHSHSLLLANASESVGDTVVGYYPSNVTNLDGKPLYVVQVLWAGKYIGNLDVTWDADTGDLLQIQGKPILLTYDTPKDPEVNATVAAWRAPFDALSKQVIGSTLTQLNRSICFQRDCPLGAFVAGSMLAAAKDQGAQIALINSGGMRIDLLAGDITQGDILTLLPFSNYLVVYNFTGQDLYDTFESVAGGNGTKNIITNASVAGAFMQLEGARFQYSSAISGPPRVITAQVRTANGTWQDVVRNQTYSLVTLDFVATGGDAIVTKVVKPGQLPTLQLLSEVAIDYVKKNSPLNLTFTDYICDQAKRNCSWTSTAQAAAATGSKSWAPERVSSAPVALTAIVAAVFTLLL